MPPWSGGASKDAIIAGNNRSRCKAFTRSSPNPKPSRPIHQTCRSRVSPATRRHPPPRETAAQHPTPRCSLPNAKPAPQQRRERTHTRGRRPGILFSDGKAVAGDVDWTPPATRCRGAPPRPTAPGQPPRQPSSLRAHHPRPAAPRNATPGAAHASTTARARQAQIEPAWPRSGLRGRARGHLPPRPRRPPHRSHHCQQAAGRRRPTAGAVEPAAADENPSSPEKPPANERKRALPPPLRPGFARRRPPATAGEREEVEGGRWSRGYGASRAAPGESDAGGDALDR
jgi:hypothetical protein